ncbi:MAG: hypothetical protein ABSG13_24365 [Bryobacteraceae bacterium]
MLIDYRIDRNLQRVAQRGGRGVEAQRGTLINCLAVESAPLLNLFRRQSSGCQQVAKVLIDEVRRRAAHSRSKVIGHAAIHGLGDEGNTGLTPRLNPMINPMLNPMLNPKERL